MHTFNKLNDATIPAQTPISRKDMVLNSMSGSVIFCAIDLTDGFYHILMQHSDIQLTGVSYPEWYAREWMVIPLGLTPGSSSLHQRPLRRHVAVASFFKREDKRCINQA